MCVNLKTFNESFRKWAEEREEEEELVFGQAEVPVPDEAVNELLLTDLDRKKIIARQQHKEGEGFL